jgi:hypothetical protein
MSVRLGVGIGRGGARNYVAQVKQIFGPSLIGYWPLSEASGSVAVDWSGNGRHGAHTGVTLGQTGICGYKCPLYDGANDFTNIYSVGLAGAFNPLEGTLMTWARASGAGVWTDGALRRMVMLLADSSNRVYIYKSSFNNLLGLSYIAGGVTKDRTFSVTSTDWLHLVITWSKSADEVRRYSNGALQSGTSDTLGTWVGALGSAACCIGAATTTPTEVWSGLLGHVAIGNRALSPTEINLLYTNALPLPA